MKAIKTLSIACSLMAFNSASASQALYLDASQPVEKRVDDLLERMTLEEKVAQLQTIWRERRELESEDKVFLGNQAKAIIGDGIGQIARPSENKTPTETAEFNNAAQQWLKDNTRLGIPAIMHEEALHGFAAWDAISFPQAIALASTWQPEYMHDIYAIAAEEIRATGGHFALTPILDVARDPRWGRIEETMGEDPYLIAAMGVAGVKGFQGDQGADAPMPADKVIATLKHMTGHGQPDAGVNIAPAGMGERELREVFLLPFEAAVKEAGVGAIMASYNEIDGVPSHINKHMLTDILRGEWQFPGVLVSDYYAINDLITRHKLFDNQADAAAAALKAGVDVEMPFKETFPNLVTLVKQGKLDEQLIDRSVRRVLRQKFHLGLFENPFVDVANAEAMMGQDKYRQLAVEVAEDAMVLLKNDGTLPLDIDAIKRLAVIGPHANETLLGGYSSVPKQTVTIVDGLKNKLAGKAEVLYAPGTQLIEPLPEISEASKRAKTSSQQLWVYDPVKLAAEDKSLLQQAVSTAEKSDAVLLVLGENEGLSREAWDDKHMGDRTSLQLVGNQLELAKAILATGKPVVLLLTNGRPLALGELTETMPAIIEGWYLGQETGTAVANVLFGDANPSGKLPLTFPRSAGHIPSYYNYKPSAKRGYLFDDITPLYPFGHGLSYTRFSYSDLQIDSADTKQSGKVSVSMTLTNSGKRKGTEVVQLYINDPVASTTRPVKALKGFAKVELDTGESRQINFELPLRALAFYNSAMEYVVEPGQFNLMIGSSSADIRLQDSFTISSASDISITGNAPFFTDISVK